MVLYSLVLLRETSISFTYTCMLECKGGVSKIVANENEGMAMHLLLCVKV